MPQMRRNRKTPLRHGHGHEHGPSALLLRTVGASGLFAFCWCHIVCTEYVSTTSNLSVVYTRLYCDSTVRRSTLRFAFAGLDSPDRSFDAHRTTPRLDQTKPGQTACTGWGPALALSPGPASASVVPSVFFVHSTRQPVSSMHAQWQTPRSRPLLPKLRSD